MYGKEREIRRVILLYIVTNQLNYCAVQINGVLRGWVEPFIVLLGCIISP